MGGVKCVLDESIDDRGLAYVLIADENNFGFEDVLFVGGIADLFFVFFHGWGLGVFDFQNFGIYNFSVI